MTKVDVSLVFQYHRFFTLRLYISDSSVIAAMSASVLLMARVATVGFAVVAIGSSLTSVA